MHPENTTALPMTVTMTINLLTNPHTRLSSAPLTTITTRNSVNYSSPDLHSALQTIVGIVQVMHLIKVLSQVLRSLNKRTIPKIYRSYNKN